MGQISPKMGGTTDHTYFIGEAGWGFTVWAHNACTVGSVGEAQAEAWLKAKGLTLVGKVQNNSGHGIEISAESKFIIALTTLYAGWPKKYWHGF